MALKAQAQFTNKYEQAFNLYRSSPFFNEEDWRRIAMGNDASNLDMYINALSLSKDINKKDFDEKYGTEFQDSDTRLAALYNEVYGSRVANDDRYAVDVYKYDEVGNMLYDEAGNPKTERKTISEYQYNKMIISQQNEARRQAHLKELSEEAKDPNAWGTAGALVVDVAFDGLIEFFNKTGALGKTLIDMARSDKTFVNDWFTQWENNYKPVLDRIVVDGKSLSQHMLDFEKEFTHLRDTDGNLTGFGRIATGVATTAGEMLGSIITGGILAAPLGAASAGAGTVAKIATGATKVIRTAAYYAPLAAYGMGESYKEITANGNSIATSKMITNQLWKTGAEISIEMALGKVFGTTGLDKMLFGRTGKVVKKTGKVGTLGGLAHFAGEALQEGTEEFLQEYSGFLVDSAYAKLVDESFKTEFSMQNLVDAAIIGAIISGASSITTISATKGKIIDTKDGTIKLGKIASAYYNASMPTFLQKLETAQKSLDDLISGIPSKEKIEGLTKRKTQIESELKSVNEQISKTTFFTPDVKKLSMAQELASDIGKGYALNQSLELVKNKQQVSQMPETLLQRRESLQRSLLEVDSQINQASKISATSEITVSSKMREEVAESFRALYTAARAVQSFVSVIGEARMTKAAEILGRIEKMGNEGKFDKTEVSKARNEMIKELQLSGISIDRSLASRIANADMSKVKKIFKRKDLENNKVSRSQMAVAKIDVEYAEKFAEKLFAASPERETVVICEDGDKVAANDETILVPEKESELGPAQVLHDEAEQRLTEAILKYKFSGDVINKVHKAYKDIFGIQNASKEEALVRLIFDPSFFATMLLGENESGEKITNIADLDMYKFLSSLYDIEKSVISNNIRNGVYKTKLSQAKKSIVKSFQLYLCIQPFADYNLSIFTKTEIDEIKKFRESFEVANRLVSGAGSDLDWNYILKKLNALSIEKQEKTDLENDLKSNKPDKIRSALITIDDEYRKAFYGSYDGETYMPTNSIKNRAFNAFLFSNGITVKDVTDFDSLNNATKILVAENGQDVKDVLSYYSQRFSVFTNGRYELRLTEAKNNDAYSGSFYGRFGSYPVQIVDNYAKSDYDIDRDNLKQIGDGTTDSFLSRSDKNSKFVKNLLSAQALREGGGYYDIDDIVTNPNLLKKTIQNKINNEYGSLTSEEVYYYLKNVLKEDGSDYTITLGSDGKVVFVKLDAVKDLLSVDNVKGLSHGEIKLSKFLRDPDAFPWAKDVVVRITTLDAAGDFYIETSENRRTSRILIRIDKSQLKNSEKFKTTLAHELQHAIQEFNKLNRGSSKDILEVFSEKDKKTITDEIRENIPSLFDDVTDESEVASIINDFLYYNTGEIDAYGYKDALYFYPILIQEQDTELRITLPWGSSFTGKIASHYRSSKIDEKETKIDANVHLYSKGRTPRSRVPKKATKGTPLQAFAGKRISEPLQDFIMKSAEDEYRGIDRRIKAKILDGTLRTSDLYEYLREADSEDSTAEKTFELINNTIFHNKYIKSLKELDEYILLKTANYYGLRRYLIATGKKDMLKDIEDPTIYNRAMEMLDNDLELKKKITDLIDEYWVQAQNEKNLRRLWMEHFDGSIEKGGYIASVASIAAKAGWTITGGSVTSSSLNMSAGTGKSGSSIGEVGDKIADKAMERQEVEDLNEFLNIERRDRLVAVMQQDAIQKFIERLNAGENITRQQVEDARKEIYDNIFEMYFSKDAASKKEFADLYFKYVKSDEETANALYYRVLARQTLGEDRNVKDSDALENLADEVDAAREAAKQIIRPKSYVIANIKSITRTIRNNLNREQRKRFLKDNSDLFNDELKVIPSLYQDVRKNGVIRLKDESILLEIEERVRQLSNDVKSGVYSSEDSLKYKKLADRKIRKLEQELIKALKSSGKTETRYVTIYAGGQELDLDTDKELPLVIKRFMDTALTKREKTNVQLLSKEDDYHVKMSYNEFLEINAETLNNLTQEDADEIIDFYTSTVPVSQSSILYSSIELWTLGYLEKMSGKNSSLFSLTNEQMDRIEARLSYVAERAGTDLAVWKSVLKELRPEETIHRAMLKECDIELSPATEGELIMAINSGDMDRIVRAKQHAYEEALERHRGRKRTVFDRLLRYERMAMLSGPGTWVRNQVSNILVEQGNKLSELLTSFLPESKKSKKLKQYKITGTRVDTVYQTWIKNSVIDNGLLDLISDGLIKYDIRRTDRVGMEDQFTKLIISKIKSELFDVSYLTSKSGDNSKIAKVDKFITDFMKTVMSDKRSINRSFIRYLGKMLTEDKADVSQGLNGKLMDTIAEAYTMAMQDYMHISNFWNKLEGTLRTYLRKRFNPTTADGIFFLYKQVFPFANASWNWFIEGLNYTPVGLAKGIFQFCRLENTVNRIEEARQKGERVRSARFAEYIAKRNIGKGIIGSVGLGVGILLAALGKVRLDDDDKYKLYIDSSDGPIYIDFSDVFGTNGILLGMSIGQSFRDSNGFNYDSFMKVLTSSLNTMFLDSTFADMFNTFRYSESFGDYLTTVPTDIAGMFVPNFIKTLGNTFKKYNVTYSSGLLGKLERFAVQSFAPFSYLMPYVVNPYTGEPEIINEGWFGINIVNRYTPIKVKNYNFGDIEKTAVSLGVKKQALTGRYKIGDVKVILKAEEVENLNEFYGRLNAKELENFMMNKTSYVVENQDGKREELVYKKMTDKQKAAVIERIMSNNSSLAKVYILTSNGEYKYYANESEYELLRTAGIISNVYREQGKLKGFIKVN